MEKILISACLVGHQVRYDGDDSQAPGDDQIARWHREGRLVAVCPEVAGGLSVPRPAAEIRGGDGRDVVDRRARLVTEAGDEVTDAFVAGADHALQVARDEGLRMAILKSKSPSCGTEAIYDGTFSGTKRDGMGVAAAVLQRAGIAVFSERRLDEARRHLAELEARD